MRDLTVAMGTYNNNIIVEAKRCWQNLLFSGLKGKPSSLLYVPLSVSFRDSQLLSRSRLWYVIHHGTMAPAALELELITSPDHLSSKTKMKIVLASILAAVPAAAFAPSMARPVVSTSLSAAAGAAKSAEEDLELTLKVIMDSLEDDGSGIDDSDDDTPYEEPVAAAAPAAAAASSVELWSVDYDAAARLAYEAAGSSGDFESFKAKYLEETSAMVAQKGLL